MMKIGKVKIIWMINKLLKKLYSYIKGLVVGCDHVFVVKARQVEPIDKIELSVYSKGKYRKVKSHVIELFKCEKCHEEQFSSFYELEGEEDED